MLLSLSIGWLVLKLVHRLDGRSIVWSAACLFVGLLVVCVRYSVCRSVVELFGRSTGWCLTGWIVWLVVGRLFGQWVNWILGP